MSEDDDDLNNDQSTIKGASPEEQRRSRDLEIDNIREAGNIFGYEKSSKTMPPNERNNTQKIKTNSSLQEAAPKDDQNVIKGASPEEQKKSRDLEMKNLREAGNIFGYEKSSKAMPPNEKKNPKNTQEIKTSSSLQEASLKDDPNIIKGASPEEQRRSRDLEIENLLKAGKIFGSEKSSKAIPPNERNSTQKIKVNSSLQEAAPKTQLEKELADLEKLKKVSNSPFLNKNKEPEKANNTQKIKVNPSLQKPALKTQLEKELADLEKLKKVSNSPFLNKNKEPEKAKKPKNDQRTRSDEVDPVSDKIAVGTSQKIDKNLVNKPDNSDKFDKLEGNKDPITEAVRKEIIKQQKLVIFETVQKNLETKGEIRDLEEKGFINTKEGKELFTEALKSPELQKKLSNLEQKGYAKVLDDFKDSFRDLEWKSENQNSSVQKNDVRNDQGELVCTLTKSINTGSPKTVTLSDGTQATLNSYSLTDIPLKTNETMHLTLAVENANGGKISKNNAVYLTVHFDDTGKLSELSSPQPVKFTGEGKDAICYIEKDGKPYTLGVTKDKYLELQREVAKNNGLYQDYGQSLGSERENNIIKEQIKKAEPKSVLGDKAIINDERPSVQLQDKKAERKRTDDLIKIESSNVTTPKKTPDIMKMRKKLTEGTKNPVSNGKIPSAPNIGNNKPQKGGRG